MESRSLDNSAVNYAFLNHSTTTLPHNLPPNVDDRPLARHKRKRTSPEDQAILENAYKRDPKPDKPARLELVKQVSLGEKEVQIWFQNRRQSSRRKSRPLLPHEIAQYQLARGGESSSPMIYDADVHARDEEPSQHAADGLDEEAHASFRHAGGHQYAKRIADQPSKAIADSLGDSERQELVADASPAGDARIPREELPSDLLHSGSIGTLARPSADMRPRPGYLANRRSASSIRPEQLQPAEAHGTRRADVMDDVPSSLRLRKSSSFIRLSMSVDGNASVTTRNESSPSPPRLSQGSMTSADEGQSTQTDPIPHLQLDATANRVNLQRSSSGRSRDSRTWEFWCDKDARAELEEKAEKDASGSAADAIGLLRSASGRSILGSVPSKRNSFLARPLANAKRPRLQEKVPTLPRSSTSSGRLQGSAHAFGSASAKIKAKPKLVYSGSAVSVHNPGNDSDKENWSPGHESTIETESKPLDNNRPSKRAALGDGNRQANRALRSARDLRTAKLPKDHEPADNENVDPDSDPEVAAFMHSGRKSNSTSSEDELDCVQGLLSLSQGNWQ